MEGYGIEIGSKQHLSGRYRAGDTETWDLEEAETIAYALLLSRQAAYVTVGNGEHEFRMWGDVDVTSYNNNFSHNGRWSEWYVDVEINGRRWIYRPLADIREYEGADGADDYAEMAAGLAPYVTRLWVGRSDGSEEVESPVGHD